MQQDPAEDTDPSHPAKRRQGRGLVPVAFAVAAGQRVLGMGETPEEAWQEARTWCGRSIPTAAILMPITAAARTLVWDWGDAVANLRTCDGVLCTAEEAAREAAPCTAWSVPPGT